MTSNPEKSPAPKQVLWLEDQPGFIQHMVRLLERRGPVVEVITDVRELRGRLEQEEKKYDLILLDLMMPAHDEFQDKNTHQGIITGKLAYSEIIKKISPKTPVIILTGLSERIPLGREARDYFEGEFQVKDVLPSDMDPREMIKTIIAILEEASGK